MSAEVRNPWKLAKQREKAMRLVNAVDLIAVDSKVDPVRNPMAVIRALTTKRKAWWDTVAKAAKVVEPSTDTVELVFEMYRDRLDQLALARVAS